MTLSPSERRKLILSFAESHPESTAIECFNELNCLKITKNMCYCVYQRYHDGENIVNHQNCGNRAVKMNQGKIKRFLNKAEGWTGSKQELADKYGISRWYCRHLLEKHGIKTYKKIDAPKTTPDQAERQHDRLEILANDLLPVSGSKHLVEDDESYFPLSGKLDKSYLASDSNKIPIEIRIRPRAKFERRLCVWIAISPKGHSEPFFTPANCAINADIYRHECIEKKLVPFLKKNYPKGRYLFWPDGATCHYANSTIETLEKHGIKYVRKQENPPNIPQLRCIKKFWANLKRKVYQNSWKAKNFSQLKRRICLKLKEFEPADFSRLFRNEKVRIAFAAINGPLSVLGNKNLIENAQN
jgi:hypothetical protein